MKALQAVRPVTAMRRMAVGGVLLAGMLAVSALGGCLCPPKPRDVAPEPPRAAAPVYVPPAPTVPTYVAPTPPKTPVVDKTDKLIRDLHEQYPDLFDYDKDKGMLRFHSDITFDSGSSTVKAQARTALTRLAKILANDEAKDRTLTVVGHTDAVRVGKKTTIDHLKRLGKSPDNMGLSEARAEAVAAVLRAGGVRAARMSTMGKGQGEPISDNTTPAGKARNRRVEIFISPLSGGPAGGGPAVTVPGGESGEVPSGGGDGMRVIDIPAE